MASFVIEGGHRLSGEIHPQGAKNEVLQIICATLLTAEEVTVDNIPDILDVNNLIQLMREMGVTVSKKGIDSYSFKAENVDLAYLESDEFLKKCSSLRGSVMLIGPMVARFGKALISKPGGDKIGRRRLDTHFLGIQNLGADFRYDEGRGIYEITADRLQGNYMLLDEASVTGTANIVMAAVLAQRKNTILKLSRLEKFVTASRTSQRNYHYLQRCLRALPATTVPDAEPHGCPDQRYSFQPSDD